MLIYFGRASARSADQRLRDCPRLVGAIEQHAPRQRPGISFTELVALYGG